jgi:7-carboxy-7-deazaguanine synthase
LLTFAPKFFLMPISTQAISYPLMEHFYTIQGEGANTGKAAYFLRLGGCDVGCVWCDVKDSWDAAKHPPTKITDMLQLALKAKATTVVVTGGEPCMYDLTPLCDLFRSKGITLLLETSGAYTIRGKWDWVCISPKKFKAPLAINYKYAHELKVVVYNKHDFAWAEQHAALLNTSCKLYLQPEWDKEKEMLPLIIDYVKKNPQWQISLQTHKYMNIP